jgi:hypothetical protein
LLHELAHIARRDIVGHTMAGLSCAVYWFHPLVWIAARRLRLESEMACDSIVLETGMAPADYAQHLLDLMTNLGPRVPAAAVGLGRPTEFEGRFAAILDGTSKKATLSRARLGAILGCLVLLVVTVAAVIPVPRVQSGDVTPSPALGHVAVGVTVDAPRGQLPTEALERNSRVSGRSGGTTIARDFADRKKEAEGLSDSTIALLRRDGVAAIVNPMLEILREADSLGIRGSQGDSIATISRWYTIRRDLIWSALLAEPGLRVDSPERLAVSAAFDGATVATLSLLADAGARVLAVLTPEQRSKLSARTAAYLVAHPRSPGTGWSRRTASVVASSDRGDHYVRRGRGGG